MKVFGSNVQPRNFGKGGSEPQDWTCLCGYVNKGRRVKKVAGHTVCWMCEVEKDLIDLAQRIEDYDGEEI